MSVFSTAECIAKTMFLNKVAIAGHHMGYKKVDMFSTFPGPQKCI